MTDPLFIVTVEVQVRAKDEADANKKVRHDLTKAHARSVAGFEHIQAHELVGVRERGK